MLTAVMLTVATACSHSDDSGSDEPTAPLTAILHLRVSLGETGGAVGRAPADELPADDGEKMHTVRIIITDPQGYTEHNSLWDLRSNPAILASGEAFPVKANETKKIILVANEDYTTLRLHDGSTIEASDYFNSFSAATGMKVDLDELAELTMTGADNSDPSVNGSLRKPLAISAIHEYHIGSELNYSAEFLVHRAAVKYLFRFTNADPAASHAIKSIRINNVASRQYFFPDADWTDDTQQSLSAYRSPDATGSEQIYNVDLAVPSGETAEAGPFYLPEGHVSTAANPYCIGFTADILDSGLLPLKPVDESTSQTGPVMTDLPRNTFVIVNVRLSISGYSLQYTVCHWDDKGTINIPPFE